MRAAVGQGAAHEAPLTRLAGPELDHLCCDGDGGLVGRGAELRQQMQHLQQRALCNLEPGNAKMPSLDMLQAGTPAGQFLWKP